MEMYAFNEALISKLLVNFSPKTKATGKSLLDELSGPLQFLFAIRLTNIDMKLGLKWIYNLEKFCKTSSGHFTFDAVEYERRYMRIHVTKAKAAEFENKRTQLEQLFQPDSRFQIRGHDFVKLLTWILKKKHNCSHLNEDSVRQMLYMSIPSADLRSMPLFSALLQRSVR